jgi:hypothetical protein
MRVHEGIAPSEQDQELRLEVAIDRLSRIRTSPPGHQDQLPLDFEISYGVLVLLEAILVLEAPYASVVGRRFADREEGQVLGVQLVALIPRVDEGQAVEPKGIVAILGQVARLQVPLVFPPMLLALALALE